jgi:glutaconate CoA-transferase subunit A
MAELVTLQEAAKLVRDGSHVGFGGGNALWRRPLAFARELIRQGRRELEVHAMLAGIETDLLLGAGCVARTHASYVGLDELGQSEHFQRLVRARRIEAVEYTEYTFIAALRAAGMALPFLPWKTGIGTDVVRELGWTEIECPYSGQRLLAVPAMTPDVSVIQALRCDQAGNVELVEPYDFIYDYDLLMARAATTVIVCAEEIGELSSPSRCGLLGREVDYVVHAPRGAWPGGFVPTYAVDDTHLKQEYVPATRDDDAFAAYLERFVL